MIRSYFVIAIRHILRNKIQSIIQVLSLTIGITAMILIGLYADHELSYDKFNEKLDRIYRLDYSDWPRIHSAIGHAIKENFSEVENVVRIRRSGKTRQITYVYEDDENSERKVQWTSKYLWCDSTIFDIFTLPFIQGNPETALQDPFSVVISESTARAIFGNKDPLGETIDIEFDTPRARSYTVTGIIHDVVNFHLDFDILLSIVSTREMDGSEPLAPGDDRLNAYGWSDYNTYLLLPHPHDKTRTENNINAFFGDKMKETNSYSEGSVFSLRPLREIYFGSPMSGERGYCLHGNLNLLKILLTIAAVILILACINYINLTTARASLRAREVGVRKVMGSLRSRLMAQFVVESVLISLVSFLLAITIVQVLLPSFIQMTGYELEISLERLFQPQTILFTITGILLLGLMAGIYPAFYMTTFQPVASLKGEQKTGKKSVLYRRILLSLQFTISVVLIIGVLMLLKQLKFMKTADLGFDKELIVTCGNIGGESLENREENCQVIKESLLKHPNIIKVSFGTYLGMERRKREFNFFIKHDEIQIKPNWLMVDPDYFDLLDINILEGRDFSWDREADYMSISGDGFHRIIINETARRAYQLESPLGAILTFENGWRAEIIGVVEDFHFLSLHHEIEPTLYFWAFRRSPYIKILPYDIQGTIMFIKKEYESMFPDGTFKYSFLDETINQEYESDDRLSRIISNFAIVALLISCLGLFGLSTFMAARRTKEIGIRKTMGASVRIVFLLLSREFAVWVTISIIIACPVAWIIMNRWLQGFAYRTSIGIGIFILAILIAFAIAFLTVAWQSWKTARTNPVEALRYE